MFDKDAQPICLPNPALDYENVSTVITGWGQNSTDPKDKGHPAILQEGNLKTIPNSKCKKFKWKFWLLAFWITENMICAVNPTEGACHGDSGSPLITLNKNGTYQQIGIASFVDNIIDMTNYKQNIKAQCLLNSPNVFSR